MDENKNNNSTPPVEDVPLEELRARYLRKRPLFTITPTSTNQGTTTWSVGGSSTQGSSYQPRAKRTGLRLACDIILLLATLIVSVLTVFYFAVPTTEIGGEVFYGETINLFDFILGEDNSIIAQIKSISEEFSKTEIDPEDALSAVSAVMKLFRFIFLLFPAIIVALKTVINTLKAVYFFYNQESASLGDVAVRNIAKNLMAYVFFVFFGSVSGGVGEDAYFVGYTIGTGMTIGMLIGLALVIAASICTYLLNKGRVNAQTDGLDKWLKVLSSGIGYMGIAVVLTFMRIYSVFVYVLTSSLSTVILSVMTGFEFKSLIFPLLNLFLFIVCININGRVTKGFSGSFKYLMYYGDKSTFKNNVKNALERTASISFIPVIVLSLLSVGAVVVLRNPTFGFGWSVDIYEYFVYIFLIASVSQTLLFVFSDKGNFKLASYAQADMTSATIPEGVTSIVAHAFHGCSSLEGVTIPDKVTSIGEYAFKGCSSLKTITIPASVRFIGEGAFKGCSSLTDIIFEEAEGWFYSPVSKAVTKTSIGSFYLSNPSTASTYLRSTYSKYKWKRG